MIEWKEAEPDWTLDDLQYCADTIDQKYNISKLKSIFCNHANRRHLIKLMDAEMVVRDGKLLMTTRPESPLIVAVKDLANDIMYFCYTDPNEFKFAINPKLREIRQAWWNNTVSPYYTNCG